MGRFSRWLTYLGRSLRRLSSLQSKELWHRIPFIFCIEALPEEWHLGILSHSLTTWLEDCYLADYRWWGMFDSICCTYYFTFNITALIEAEWAKHSSTVNEGLCELVQHSSRSQDHKYRKFPLFQDFPRVLCGCEALHIEDNAKETSKVGRKATNVNSATLSPSHTHLKVHLQSLSYQQLIRPLWSRHRISSLLQHNCNIWSLLLKK